MDQETVHALRPLSGKCRNRDDHCSTPLQQTSTTAHLLSNSDHTIPSNFYCQQAAEVELFKYLNCDLSLQIPWTWQRGGKKTWGIRERKCWGHGRNESRKTPDTYLCRDTDKMKNRKETQLREKSYPLAHWITKLENISLCKHPKVHIPKSRKMQNYECRSRS